MQIRSISIALLIAVTLSGCGRGRSGDTGEWLAITETTGRVTTVRTISGSIWKGTAILIEELSIGETGGEDASLFGNLVGLAADDDFIYVLDDQVPVLRVFDREGNHVRDIGRRGEGPGEFRNPTGVGLSPIDGRIFVHEGGGGRINVYSREGRAIRTWHIRPFNTYWPPMVVSSEGVPFVCTLLNPGASVPDWRNGMVGYGTEGSTGDTLAEPDFDYEVPRIPAGGERSRSNNPVPFAPRVEWVMSPSGAIVAGLGTQYRITVDHPDGAVTVIEKASWERVPVLPEEAAWYREMMTVFNRAVEPGWTWNGPPIPADKPAFERFVPDRSRRIWVVCPGPGERVEGGTERSQNPVDYYFNPLWRDAPIVDVFTESGSYLGRVDIPAGFRWFLPHPWIEDDIVVAAVEDDTGILRVKCYRLVPPS